MRAVRRLADRRAGRVAAFGALLAAWGLSGCVGHEEPEPWRDLDTTLVVHRDTPKQAPWVLATGPKCEGVDSWDPGAALAVTATATEVSDSELKVHLQVAYANPGCPAVDRVDLHGTCSRLGVDRTCQFGGTGPVSCRDDAGCVTTFQVWVGSLGGWPGAPTVQVRREVSTWCPNDAHSRCWDASILADRASYPHLRLDGGWPAE